MYGDISFLADNYSAMQKYMNAYEKNIENGLVVRGCTYGDWLAMDGEMFKNCIHGRTDIVFLASVFYAECLRVVLETAKALGKKEEQEYRRRYEKRLRQSDMNILRRAGGLPQKQ